MPIYQPLAPTLYRTGVTSVDVISATGALTTGIHSGGGLADDTYKSKVVAGNTFGRTTATAGTDRATSVANNSVKIAFVAVTGATYFDIYLSVDADPKWVGRITEAQRAAGCVITAVGTVTLTGGEAGSVIVNVVGTGLQSLVTAAVNTAYAVPAAFDVGNHENVNFDIIMSIGGDSAALTLVVVPYFYDGTNYFAGTPVTVTFGGTSGQYGALKQRVSVLCKGRNTGLLVQSITGLSASLEIYASVA